MTFSHHTLDLPEKCKYFASLKIVLWSLLHLLILSILHSPEQRSHRASTWFWHSLRDIQCIYLHTFQKHKSNPDIFFLTTDNQSVSFHGFHDQAFPGPHICPYWPFHSHLTYPSLLSAHELQWFSVSSLSSTHPRHFSLLADFSTSFSLLQSLSFIYGKSHRCN